MAARRAAGAVYGPEEIKFFLGKCPRDSPPSSTPSAFVNYSLHLAGMRALLIFVPGINLQRSSFKLRPTSKDSSTRHANVPAGSPPCPGERGSFPKPAFPWFPPPRPTRTRPRFAASKPRPFMRPSASKKRSGRPPLAMSKRSTTSRIRCSQRPLFPPPSRHPRR